MIHSSSSFISKKTSSKHNQQQQLGSSNSSSEFKKINSSRTATANEEETSPNSRTVQERLAATLLLLADERIMSKKNEESKRQQAPEDDNSNQVSLIAAAATGAAAFATAAAAEDNMEGAASTKRAAVPMAVAEDTGEAGHPKKRQRSEAQAQGARTSANAKTGSSDEGSDDDGPVLKVNVPLFENHMLFPDQLWELLKYPEELEDAIWWMPGNDAFAINEPAFSDKLLESHFRGNKFTSIIRKLNRWGFRKYVDRSLPPKTVAYYHRSFQKGRPELVKLIEKEEGKMGEQASNANAPSSQFSLFPQATTSQRIAHVLQPNAGTTPALFAATANSTLAALPLSSRLALGSSAPAAATTAAGNSTLGGLPSHLPSPLNQRSHASILQSIFGQRVPVSAPAPATAPTASVTGTSSLAAAVAAATTSNPSTRIRGIASLAAAANGPASHRHRELLASSNLQLLQQQQQAANDSVEQQALLRSMVNNIEREREQRQQEGRLLLAIERERSRLMDQESKQESDLPVSEADASLFSLMATGQRDSFTGQQPTLPGQQDHTSRLLAAAAACRQGQSSRRSSALQLQAAIASPNPFASPLGQSSGLARRVLGQDSLALPSNLLLSPTQQRYRQVLQLQQRREQEDQQRGPPNLPPNFPPGNNEGR
ncbi:shock transcription factor, X-linked member [Seminavis robusta]|uniref:Shock transcription factor, X-linked member n=1 Tax=Seminavis robusta TaxID=568900 RepID=A0A9N8E8N1_9STRA|nr:shock transcription factor, X-linked member [Seminavis robusta]|eukprot:Sro629_g178180.1 shock transcription factor, X-linked member (657) ;mRNA; r:21113-23476